MTPNHKEEGEKGVKKGKKKLEKKESVTTFHKVPPPDILPRRSSATLIGSWPQGRAGNAVLKPVQGGTTEELGFPTGSLGACADGCSGEW